MADTYLITGGTGTLGQAIAKHILSTTDSIARIFSRNEYYQWQMRKDIPDKRLRFLIGDVRDRDRLKRAMSGCDYVVHCAALKHVDICEYNPIEVVRTNIDGAVNIVDAAIDTGVKKVLAVSSDKAVYPLNIYGASKLCGEKLFLHANVYGGDTSFAVMRCGNFWGSRGSVMELFAMNKGMITITDPNMRRYVIEIDRAASHAVKFLNEMNGGEIFVSKMENLSVSQIADRVAPNATRIIIGPRPGEKLTEELYTDDEQLRMKDMGDYYVIKGDVCR
jgi:FlaA1/EpsC-like NDP-sugar epimerase